MPADPAWIADLELAMSQDGPDAPWRVMALRKADWLEDREVSLRYCALADHHPSGADLAVVDAIAASASKASDYECVVAAVAALNGLASRRPLDAPPRDEGPEHRAAAYAKGALEGAPRDAIPYLQINLANALRAMGPEHDDLAQEAYATALGLEPERGAWHLEQAILHKWRGRWQACFDATMRARSRLGETRGVLWNFALAATALGEGDLAAGAWRDLGIPNVRLGAGGLPLVEGVPPRRIRVRSKPSGFGVVAHDAGFELLSVTPLSPGHGVVSSASFEETPLDFGDIVLWDGAPVAVDRDGPIFPALELLRAGDEKRYRFVAIVRAGEVEALREAMGEGVRLFVHDGDADAPASEERLVYGKLISANHSPALLRTRLEAYGAKVRTLRLAMPALYEALGDSRRAGQEHQAWRGVERAAIKRGLVPSR